MLQLEPEEANYRSALAIALAGLGRKTEAIREAKTAVERRDRTHPAFNGLYPLQDLAKVYVMVGEYDAALTGFGP